MPVPPADPFEESPDLLAVLDARGVVVALNGTGARMLEVDREAMLGRPLEVFIHHEDQLLLRGALQASSSGAVRSFTVRWQLSPRRWLPLQCRVRRSPRDGQLHLSAHPADVEDVIGPLREHLLPVINALPVMLLAVDAQGRVVLVDGSRISHLPGGVVGQSALELFSHQPALADAIRAALEGTPTPRVLTGAPEPFCVAVTPLRKQGLVVGALVLGVDLGEQDRLQQHLRELAWQLDMVAWNTSVVPFVVDRDGRMTMSEGSTLAMLGLEDGGPAGQDIYALYRDQPQALAKLEQAFAGKSEWFTLREGPGTLEVHLQPVRDAQGEVRSLVGVAVDITQRRFTDAALKESEERLRLAVRASADGLWDVDLRTGRATMNARWYEMLGYAPGEIERTLDALQALVHPDDRFPITYDAQGRAHLPREFQGEQRFRHKDGSWRWIRVRSAVVEDPDRQPLRAVGMNTDVTGQREAESALRYQQALLQAQMEASLDGILVVDFQGRIRVVNQRFLQMWNIPAETIASADDARALQCVQDQLLEPEAFLARVTDGWDAGQAPRQDQLGARDGRVIDRYCAPVRGPDGTRYGTLVVTRDVTAVVRGQQALLRSEQFLRAVVDAVPAVMAVEQQGRVVLLNRAGVRLQEAATGVQGVLERLGFADGPTDVATPTEHDVALTDGSTRTFHSRSATVHMPDGRPARLVVSQDITERKLAEAARQRSEAQFRRLIEHLPDAVCIQREGKLVFCNAAFAAIVGSAPAESLLGRSLLELLHPDDVPTTRQHLEDAVTNGRLAPPRELRFVRADGSVAMAEAISLRTEFGGSAAALVAARDITERKQMEARLQLTDRLVAVGTLAAGVAHEINNPLSYVLTNVDHAVRELARLPELDADGLLDVVAGLREALEGCVRVRQIVRDLKSLSRLESGPQLGAVDLAAAIASAVNMTRNELRHRARVVQELDVVPPVQANAGRLGQVLINLLINAAQAIPEGAASRNQVSIATRLAGDGRVQIQVRDTGVGIPAEVLPRIFDPFFTTKPVGEGTGLGLPICHSIITALGGEIRVESQVGRGTTVTVELPTAEAPRPALPARVSKAHPTSTVLVVDDEVAVGRSVKRLLSGIHDVTVTGGGEEALQLLKEGRRYDAILCDVMMPQMTGMDLYQAVQQQVPELAGRFVFMSGGAFTPRAQHFLETVRCPRVEKPLDQDALLDALRQVVAPPSDVRQDGARG